MHSLFTVCIHCLLFAFMFALMFAFIHLFTWLVVCFSLCGGEESVEVKGPIPRPWVQSRILRNRVIHGKRVVLRHLAEHWYHEQFRPWWDIIVTYFGCVYDDVLRKVIYAAFLSTLPWPRWHPWVGREWSLLQVQLVTCWWLVGDLWSCWWLLVQKFGVSDDFGFQMNLWFRVQAEALILCSERHSQPVVSASFAS